MNESMKENKKLYENLKQNKKKENKEELDDFSIQGKISFNDFKINLFTKYALNTDKETNLITPKSSI